MAECVFGVTSLVGAAAELSCLVAFGDATLVEAVAETGVTRLVGAVVLVGG